MLGSTRAASSAWCRLFHRRCCKRNLSSPEAGRQKKQEESSRVVEKKVPLASSGANAVPPPKKIVRHGPGDGVIFLNVRGQEFTTLRSTVQINPVLWRHVSAAERNNEFTKGRAVFIDRDASQFGPILQHLRNRAENISALNCGLKELVAKKTTKKHDSTSVTIQIPRDPAARNALFMEARYYRIKEIEETICMLDVYTRFAAFVGGSGAQNPFVAASAVFANARRFLLATAGGTGLFVGATNDNTRKDAAKALEDLRELVVPGKRPEATTTTTTTDAPPAAATPQPE